MAATKKRHAGTKVILAVDAPPADGVMPRVKASRKGTECVTGCPRLICAGANVHVSEIKGIIGGHCSSCRTTWTFRETTAGIPETGTPVTEPIEVMSDPADKLVGELKTPDLPFPDPEVYPVLELAHTVDDAPLVKFIGNELSVTFDRFGPKSYSLFLRCKRLPEYRVAFDADAFTWTVTAPARYAELIGANRPAIEPDALPFGSHLFDDQSAIVRVSLDARRFACWTECGLGKTAVMLEWARQIVRRTGGRVLIVTLNEVVRQTLSEAIKFYGDSLPLEHVKSRERLKSWCLGSDVKHAIGITNYEKFNPEPGGSELTELRHLSGLCLDESSRLRSGGGKQKQAITRDSKGILYKLSCTATPAPNEVHEFFQQARFLETIRADGEVISSFFRRNERTHRWEVRPHARKAFFEYMAAWSVYVRDPRRFGWRLDMPDVPEPTYLECPITSTPEQITEADRLLNSGPSPRLFVDRLASAIDRVRLAQIARGFLYAQDGKRRVTKAIPSLKPAVVADLVRAEVASGLQVLVWTAFDAETEILSRILGESIGGKPCGVLTGKTPKKTRGDLITDFQAGKVQVLITRPRMLGFGINLQCAGAMVWSDIGDSFEAVYQGVRRAFRYGQTRSVRVHFPYVEGLEGDSLANIKSKSARFEQDVTEMENNYLAAQRRLFGKAGVA